jgi:hypothetical protein
MRSIANMLHRATAACAVVGALALGGTAHANTLDTTGFLNGSVGLTVHQGSLTENVSAGGFTGKWHSGGTPDVLSPITFWCFELTQYFSPGTSYPGYTASALGGGAVSRIVQLFQEAFSLADDSSTNSAAFQLAIWEIEYESSGIYDVTSGAGFYATGSGANFTAARDQANTWLTHLNDYSGTGLTIALLSNSSHQDFITAGLPPSACCKREIPEPPLLPLVLAAMGAAALVESRRRLRSRGV